MSPILLVIYVTYSKIIEDVIYPSYSVCKKIILFYTQSWINLLMLRKWDLFSYIGSWNCKFGLIYSFKVVINLFISLKTVLIDEFANREGVVF